MKIILDCFGGDNCPNAPVEGALKALECNKNLEIVLAGNSEELAKLLENKVYDRNRISFLDASEVISNDDSPALAIRRKKDSSMVKGLRSLANDEADAFVSSGNTGALLAGATIIVKLIDGVTRATLAPVSPQLAENKYLLIADGGANVDCKANQLKEFAIMGDAYMRSCYGIENPRIGLLSNGAEEEKGNQVTKEAHQLLKNTNLNFVGNVEARYLMNDQVDVVVTDGWAGNVILKSSEGMALNLFSLIKENILKGGLRAKLGYLLLKPALRNVKHKFNSDDIGGAGFLGVKKVVVKAHGSSNETAFMNAILMAEKMVSNNMVEKIEQGLKENQNKEKEE